MVYAGSSSINKDYTKKEKLVNSSHRQTAICNLTRLTKEAMASRRSHAASNSRSSISTVSRRDTYLSETHCKLRRSAAVG